MFLPEDYKSPSSSSQDNYMKLMDEENKFRILSSPIIGWEDWKGKKPVRYKNNAKPDKPFEESKPIKHFWAFIVWNYHEERIQILHVTQATIYKKIESLAKDADWGAPFFYDIKIFKSGKDKETKYDVSPCPHKDVHDFIVQEFKAKPIKLDALFEGSDPFAPTNSPTPGVFSRDDASRKPAKSFDDRYITLDQAQQIKDLIFQDVSSDEALSKILLGAAAASLEALPVDKFTKVIDWMKKRLAEQKLQADNECPF